MYKNRPRRCLWSRWSVRLEGEDALAFLQRIVHLRSGSVAWEVTSPLPMTTYRLAHWGPAVGLVSAVLFVVCFLWGFLLRDPVLQELHSVGFRILFLDAGFVGQNLVTFIAGVIVSYIGGLLAGFLLVLCLNHCQKWFP